MGKCNYMTLNIILYLISSLQVLIHYLGNEKAAQDFPHGNQKKNPDRKYCQQCPSTIGCQQGVVNVFDSGSKYVTQRNKEEIAALLHTNKDTITLQYKNVQHQFGGSDCGLFALAFATALSSSTDPTTCTFDQDVMREHFLKCIEKGQIDSFPLKQVRRPICRPVKVETFDIHCHCRMPEKKQDRMILCNGHCKQWYHDTCERIEANIWNSRLRWYCRNCKK